MKRSNNLLLFSKLLALFIFISNTVILSQSQSVHSHYFSNSFSGGQIVVNGQTENNLPFIHHVSPNDNNWYSATATNNQLIDSYYRIFQHWKTNSQVQTYDITTNYNYWTGSNGGQLYSIDHEAFFKKLCDLTFQSNSSMYINGSSRTSPWIESVLEENSIYASANSYTSNYIDYSFDHWDNNPSSNTITASAHNTYTAVYIGKPTNSGEYASAGADVGDPIVVTWTDNPNTAVNQFQIWRRVKHNGVTGDPVLLTTVGRGVQSYTDYDYVATDGYTDDLCQYDVRAYYSTEGTYSDPDYVTAFGRLEAEIDNDLSEKNTRSLVTPTEYSITNYPNPFNPTTTINYQLPENGFVTIKVYDLLGKEIATLVNENKSAGYHRINFDAGKLTSGVYVYTITANKFIQSKKMLLMK